MEVPVSVGLKGDEVTKEKVIWKRIQRNAVKKEITLSNRGACTPKKWKTREERSLSSFKKTCNVKDVQVEDNSKVAGVGESQPCQRL